jgi:hypothetical protein
VTSRVAPSLYLVLLDSDSQPIHPRPPTLSITPCIDACSMRPAMRAPRAHTVSHLYHRFIPHPPIAPAVVEATRDIVSMSSAPSPRYLFVTKYLYRLASLSSRCRCLCCIGSLLHFLSLSLHTRIDPTTPFTTGAPYPCIVHSPFFGPTSSLPPRASSRPIPRPCPLPHAYQKIAFCGRRRIVSDYLLISLSPPCI